MLSPSATNEKEPPMSAATTQTATPIPAARELVPPRPRLRRLFAAIARYNERMQMGSGETMPRLRWY
jgi:hypothetical protein